MIKTSEKCKHEDLVKCINSERFICSKCLNTNISTPTLTESSTLREEIEEIVNPFIKEWIPNYYAHLIDSDENDGQRLRNQLETLFKKELEEAYERGWEDRTFWPTVRGSKKLKGR